MSPGDRASEGCTCWGSAPYSSALSSSTLWMSPVGLESHRAWRVLWKGREAQPLAGDPSPQKGSEWS